MPFEKTRQSVDVEVALYGGNRLAVVLHVGVHGDVHACRSKRQTWIWPVGAPAMCLETGLDAVHFVCEEADKDELAGCQASSHRRRSRTWWITLIRRPARHGMETVFTKF